MQKLHKEGRYIESDWIAISEAAKKFNIQISDTDIERIWNSKLKDELQETFREGTTSVRVFSKEQAIARLKLMGFKDEEIEAALAMDALSNSTKRQVGALELLKGTFQKLTTFLSNNPFVAIAGIIGAAFYGAYRYNQYLKDSLDESVEKYQDLTSEVESLESQLTEVRDRIKEIEALDSPTLIDEQELAKLKEQNDELDREIRYKKILQEQADKNAEDNAFRWLNGNKYLVSTTTTNPYSGETQVKTQEVSWDTYVKQQMQNYKDLEQQIKDTKDARDQLDKSDTDGIEAATSKIESLEQQQGKIITDIGNTYQELKENVYDVLGGDAYTEAGQAFLSVWQSVWDAFDTMVEESQFSAVISGASEVARSFAKSLPVLQSYSDLYSDITEKTKLLTSAQSKLAEGQSLTREEIAALLDAYPELIKYYNVETGKLEITIDLLQDKVDATIAGQKAALESSKNTVKAYLAEAKAAYAAAEAATALARAKGAIATNRSQQITSNASLYASAQNYYKDMQGLLSTNRGLYNEYQAFLDNLNKHRQSGNQYLSQDLQTFQLLQSKIENTFKTGLSASQKDIDKYQEMLDTIDGQLAFLDTLGDYTFDKTTSSGTSAAEQVEDAFEKLKDQLNDWFSDMEFKVDLKFNAGDIEGAASLYEQMIKKVNEALDNAYATGLTIDDDWVQELIGKLNTYKRALADLRLDEYDKLIEYNDKFDVWNQVSYTKLDVLRKKLEAINEQYIKGYISYQDWYQSFIDTAGSIYDIQRDALDELLDTVEDALKKQNDAQVESLEKQRDALTDLIELKKKLLEDTRDEADYEKEVAKRVREIAKLQERISQLALDNSREATAERIAIEEELAEKQAELTDYQSQYATDAAIDALDKQQEKYESVYDDQIDAIKAQVEDEVALRQQAIQLIDRDYRKMMQNVQGYFEKLGVTIDQELLQKLNQGLDLVSQYGSYSSADSGISQNAGSGMLGTQTVSALVQQMKQNASAWHGADTSEQKRLAEENERIAKMLRDVYGLDVWKDSAKGVWYIRLDGKTEELFRAFPTYHTGGVVGQKSTPKSDEIFALLKKGEVVLNDDQQSSLLSIFKNAGKLMQEQMAVSFGAVAKRMGSFTTHSAPAGFGTFSPSIEVNIHHNGSMTEADAKRYGQVAADTALDKLWETMQKRGIT